MKYRFLTLAALAGLPLAAHANLIFNGDFELGDVGFSSDYTLVDPNSTDPFPTPPGSPASSGGSPVNMFDEGTYTVTDVQPGAWHIFWRNDVDLTGHGQYMLFNGATTAGQAAWSQTIVPPLIVGQQYMLSFDVVTVYGADTAPASLKVSLGGDEVISVDAPLGTEQWKNVSATFTFTGSNSMASILNVETAATGNDFGIDNIVLEPVPEPATLVGIGLGLMAFIRRRRR